MYHTSYSYFLKEKRHNEMQNRKKLTDTYSICLNSIN